MSNTNWNYLNQETITDHITNHRFSFGCWTFEIKVFKLDLVYLSGRWIQYGLVLKWLLENNWQQKHSVIHIVTSIFEEHIQTFME